MPKERPNRRGIGDAGKPKQSENQQIVQNRGIDCRKMGDKNPNQSNRNNTATQLLPLALQ